MHVNQAFRALRVRQRSIADLLRTMYESVGSSSNRKLFGLILSGCILWSNFDNVSREDSSGTKGNSGKLESSSDFLIIADDEKFTFDPLS